MIINKIISHKHILENRNTDKTIYIYMLEIERRFRFSHLIFFIFYFIIKQLVDIKRKIVFLLFGVMSLNQSINVKCIL